MMATLVLTVIGDDRRGIVDELARLVQQHGGNWLGANMSRLAGKFAGIIEVSLPQEQRSGLTAALKALPDLTIDCHAGGGSGQTRGRSLRLAVTGNDRPGIVSEIAQQLRQAGANILNLESRCDNAPNWGGAIFTLTLTIEVDVDTPTEALVERLEAVADDLMIDPVEDATE